MKNLTNILREDFENIVNFELPWYKLQDSVVLITGATGLIGSLLVRFLVFLNQKNILNIKIIALVRDYKKAKQMFGELDIEFFVQDIRKPILEKLKVDYIVHCAAVTKSIDMVKNPIENLGTIIYGTENILDFANRNNVKSMVNISSMEVYGIIDEKCNKISENELGWIDLKNPRSCYPEGKRVGELLCNLFYNQNNTPVKIVRLAQTFGAGVSLNDNRVFAQFAKSVMNNDNIILHTNGNSMGNYCYTADAIKGILLLLLRGDDGETYNIVNEKNTMTIKDMANMVSKKVADNKISVVYDIPEEISVYGYASEVKMRLSAEKIMKLGWYPQYDLKNMYKRMIKHWNETK